MKTQTLTAPILSSIIEFNKKLQNQFTRMCKIGKLFRVELSGQQIWELYLKSFNEENNPKFRDPASTTKNCNNCHNFVKRYGNIVAIDEHYNIMSIFDINSDDDEEYENTIKTLTKAIKSSKVIDVFFETYAELNSLPYEACSKANLLFKLGIDKNVKRYTKEEAEKFGVVKPNEIRNFNHIYLFLDKQFVDQSGKSIESIMGNYRDDKNVFERGMEEISLDTLHLVKDLINQGSLLNGDAHLFKIEQIIPLKEVYDGLSKNQRNNWCWINSYRLPFAKFKNELIGVLCTELSQGEELNKACQSWNKRVDPANYMKVTAPITKKQIVEAKLFVEENGYVESFNRRMATISDIKASEILHLNAGKGEIKSISLFDGVKPTSTRHKRSEFDIVDEISIEKFMKDVLPGCTSIEAFLGNNYSGNLVTLTTANIAGSKPIFKWDNNYSWTFNGNLAGKSEIKEAVKDAGGNVTGVLRASMIWNEDKNDNSDLDLWCVQPNKEKIGFSTGYRKDRNDGFSSCGGQLDLDNTGPGSKIGIENIYFTDLKKLKDGKYMFYVNQYNTRSSKGFKFEIEFDGEMYTYVYTNPLRTGQNVVVAEVTVKNGTFTIEHKLPVNEGVGVSKEMYSLTSNEFHKVNLVCVSPNHWENNQVGNKHYFFMLEGCKSPVNIRSFHNENLNADLIKHRKVMEVLGSTNMCDSIDGQLSGLGFNATVKDELVVKVQGTHKRMLKIKF